MSFTSGLIDAPTSILDRCLLDLDCFRCDDRHCRRQSANRKSSMVDTVDFRCDRAKQPHLAVASAG